MEFLSLMYKVVSRQPLLCKQPIQKGTWYTVPINFNKRGIEINNMDGLYMYIYNKGKIIKLPYI